MDVVAIILIALVVLVALLAAAGYVGKSRKLRAEAAELHARAQEANEHLARAHAEDKGWERTGLEQAARDAFAQRHGGVAPRELVLVQVVDRPGIEEDEAVFHADGERLVLGRSGDGWRAL